MDPSAPSESHPTEEIGLPKSTLNNFIKEVLQQNKVKGDKSIYTLLDKITIRYVKYVSTLGCQICATKGKKTLNIEHILEALKTMNFTKHIKSLTKEPYLKEMEKDDEVEDFRYEDNMNVKQLINKKKKRQKKNKIQQPKAPPVRFPFFHNKSKPPPFSRKDIRQAAPFFLSSQILIPPTI
jgi:histone H3/H4